MRDWLTGLFSADVELKTQIEMAKFTICVYISIILPELKTDFESLFSMMSLLKTAYLPIWTFLIIDRFFLIMLLMFLFAPLHLVHLSFELVYSCVILLVSLLDVPDFCDRCNTQTNVLATWSHWFKARVAHTGCNVLCDLVKLHRFHRLFC